MKLFIRSIMLAAMVVPMSNVANAATSFDFTGNGAANNTSMLSTTSADGLITAELTSPDGNLGAYSLDGIGVKTGFFNLPGLQNGETLRVDFDQTVNIGLITLRQWEGPDEVVLGYGAGLSITLDSDSCAFCSAESFAINLVGLDYITLTGNSGLTVALLAGFDNVTLTTTEVPVPAAAWLFGSALVSLAGIGRKRKAW